jgi:hypothetical protein
MRGPSTTATLWGGGGLLLGAAAGVALVSPFYPDTDEGFAQLGWMLLAAAAGGVLALLVGAVALHRGLVRIGDVHPPRTVLVFVPTALLLGVVGAGVGALAAPAVARWLATGLGRPVGWGPQRTAVLPQRLVLSAVGCLLLGAFALEQLGAELGGHVRGPLLVWAAAVPAVALPPVLLLRRVLPWSSLLGVVAAAAALLALVVPQAVQDVRPEPARLEQIAADLPVPDGQQVQGLRTTVDRHDYWDVPVTLLSTGGPVPPLSAGAPSATARGEAAAAAWSQVLDEQGWLRDDAPKEPAYWLDDRVQQALAGRPQHELGLWARATVLPYGDGALLVLSVRP